MPSTEQHLLVLRFSSLGDVILTLPVLENALQNNPQLHLHVLTKKPFAVLFQLLPRTSVMGIDFTKDYKGIWGLWRLFRHLKKTYLIHGVADLHAVIRTKILRIFFYVYGIRFVSVVKNRGAKKNFLQHQRTQLPAVVEMYKKVFEQYHLRLSDTMHYDFKQRLAPSEACRKHFAPLFQSSQHLIAIAPFAAHDTKMYPLHKMQHIIQTLSQNKQISILLLGNGEAELFYIKKWTESSSTIISLHQWSLLEQLYVLHHCHQALVMDSANLHLAGLAKVPHIVSLWGATSPFAGFNVWQNNECIQVSLPCRPCSIYGEKKCSRGDHLCMQAIASKVIINTLRPFQNTSLLFFALIGIFFKCLRNF